MLPEFKRAIALNESIKQLRDELNRKADQEHQERKKVIADSFASASFLLSALSEPTDTECYQIAKAYLKLYRRFNQAEYKERQRLLKALQKEAKEYAGDDGTGQGSEEAIYAELPPIEP